MKLYLISQENWMQGTYGLAVVAAENENDARDMHPNGYAFLSGNDNWEGDWPTNPKYVTVEYLGETTKEKGVICASFRAG